MKIQINTDNNVSIQGTLAQRIEDIVRLDLSRFSDQITRIEVHLSDENSLAKTGTLDKRCLLEARPAGEQPIAISYQAETTQEAVIGATRKMVSLLENALLLRGKWQQ